MARVKRGRGMAFQIDNSSALFAVQGTAKTRRQAAARLGLFTKAWKAAVRVAVQEIVTDIPAWTGASRLSFKKYSERLLGFTPKGINESNINNFTFHRGRSRGSVQGAKRAARQEASTNATSIEFVRDSKGLINTVNITIRYKTLLDNFSGNDEDYQFANKDYLKQRYGKNAGQPLSPTKNKSTSEWSAMLPRMHRTIVEEMEKQVTRILNNPRFLVAPETIKLASIPDAPF